MHHKLSKLHIFPLIFVICLLTLQASLFSINLLDKYLAKEESPDFYQPSLVEEEIQSPPVDSNLSELINLEKKSQSFVLETKQIEIPGYPNSLNPAITRWQGSLLLTFRVRHPKTQLTNQIAFVWLDENFELASQPYIVEIPLNPITSISKEQDPRLITLGNRLFMVYSNIIPGIMLSEVRRVFVTEVHFDGVRFFTSVPECLLSFEDEKEQRWEKNWVPFDYKGELFLAYSLIPHRIFRLLGNGNCETYTSSLGLIQWNWGILRGGTPALMDEGQYLAFFHSSTSMKTVHSNGKNIPHYFMGAYTFSADPPFHITNISPEPIIANNFYTSPPYKTWKPLRVVFPGGLIIDENFVWVVYGRQDFELWVVKLDKKELLNSLVPVTTLLKSY